MLRAVRKTSLETGTARLQKRRKNRKSTGDAKVQAPDPRELRIPDSVIDQILVAIKVPETSGGDVGWKVFSAVESCVESFTDGQLGTNKNRYRTIMSRCNRLLRDLSKLNPTERRHLSRNLQDFERSLETIGTAALSLIPTWRPRNRPRDSVKYPHIRQLFYDLYLLGSDLTLSKDVAEAKTKGSFQEVLEILHHQLSPEIFPSGIAFNTLKEMRHWAKECLEDKAQLYLSYMDEDADSGRDEDDRSA